MLLIKLDDQGGIARYPYTTRMLKNDHPNISLPKNPDDSTLSALGVVRLKTVPRPDADVVTEGTPVQQADGSWLQVWETRPYTQAELDAQYQASVPRSVTKRQAKEALIRQGNYQQAVDSLATIVDPVEKQIAENYWSESQTFERANPILNSMATDGLGMTQAELDDLFLYAVTL